MHFSYEILVIYKILTFVRTVSCMATHVNQKIGTCSTTISTTITTMGPFIRMLHTMSKHKVKSVTCVFTCMEDIHIRQIYKPTKYMRRPKTISKASAQVQWDDEYHKLSFDKIPQQENHNRNHWTFYSVSF